MYLSLKYYKIIIQIYGKYYMNHNIEIWIEKLDKREVNFILYILQTKQPNIITPNDNKYLLHLLKNEPFKSNDEGQKIYDSFHGKIVHDELFNWIKSDLRAAIWLESFYNNYYMNYSIPKVQLYFLNNFLDNLIFNIDVAYFTPQASNMAQHQQSVGPSIVPTQGYVPHAIPEPYLGYSDPMHQQLLKNLHPMQYAQHQQQQYQQQNQPQPPQTLTNDDNNKNNQSPFFQFNFAVQEKINFLNQAKMVYIRVMTTRKDTKWLDKTNEDQIYWAVEYLKEHKVLIIPPSFYPSSIDDIFDQVCASLDAMDSRFYELSQPYEVSMSKYLFVSRMRKAWSQKKFRDRKDAESAQEYFLTRRYMNKLKKLADEYGVSSKEYLQQLIDEAYDSID